MREEKLRQEAMLRAEEERKQKELARQEMLKKQQLEFANQRAEMERQNLMKRQQEEEERRKLEMLRIEEERKRAVVQKTEKVVMEEKNSHLEELRRQDELRRLEKQRLEQMIIQESKVISGHVAKRSDDVSGLGWGNVKTGFVSKKKLGFLQREMSVDRDSNNGSPVPNGRARGHRVTFADSPNDSRPASTLSWNLDMDVRSQTPPLAGEWSSSGQKVLNSSNIMTKKSSAVSSQLVSSSQTQQSNQSFQSQSFQTSKSSQQSSMTSSVQRSSFSSSQSSSVQNSSNFEAFPGLGRIENLKIE